jgi:hypothetical protein
MAVSEPNLNRNAVRGSGRTPFVMRRIGATNAAVRQVGLRLLLSEAFLAERAL